MTIAVSKHVDRRTLRGADRQASTQQVRTEILQFIRDFKSEHAGHSPSVRDIGAACNISSTSAVVYHLKQLQKQRLITFGSGSIHLPGEQYILPPEAAVR